MHYLTETLVADRIHRIEQEAATERLARLIATEQTRAGWRRHLGNGARRLSSTLDGFATQLDPGCRPSYGRE